MKTDLTNPHDSEIASVRRYVENNNECVGCNVFAILVLNYLRHDPLLCCNVCTTLVRVCIFWNVELCTYVYYIYMYTVTSTNLNENPGVFVGLPKSVALEFIF